MSKVINGLALASVSLPAFAGGGGMGGPHTLGQNSLIWTGIVLFGMVAVTTWRHLSPQR